MYVYTSLLGNHHNQFVDVLVMLSHCTRTPAFIVAAVSLKRKVIAFFSWVLRSIPVYRPRDLAKWCQGTIHSKDNGNLFYTYRS